MLYDISIYYKIAEARLYVYIYIYVCIILYIRSYAAKSGLTLLSYLY